MRPEQAIGRVLRSGDQAPIGLAFAVGGRELVTCAHVVNAAMRRTLREAPRPDPTAKLLVEFPFGGQRGDRPVRQAAVTGWLPDGQGFEQFDLALLTAEEELPTGVHPLVLDLGDPAGPVQMWGPVAGRSSPGHVRGRLHGQVDRTRWQIDQEHSGAFRVRFGFSGGPVWRPETGRVVGVLQAASVDDNDTDCYAIGVDLIHNLHATAFQQIPENEDRLRSLLVIGGVTEETSFPAYEQAELQRFCQQLGAEISRAGLDMLVCSPFADSADFHALQGYLGEPSPGAVQLHIPRHARIEAQLEQLLLAVGPAAAERIRNWHYPGPEQDIPEAWGQAWSFCQLMALERADAVIAVGGKAGKTASTILHLAEARRQPVVPFSFLGGTAERAFRRRDWARTFPWLNVSHLQDRDGANHAVHIASEMVARRVATIAPNLAPPSRVFISRARLDAQFGPGIEELLVQRGLTIVFGEHTLPADRTIEAAIEDAVLGADLFIALWSRSYAASRYCYDEITMALDRFHAGTLRLWIINLDGSDVIPPRARRIPQILAKTPNAVVGAVNDLLNELRPGR